MKILKTLCVGVSGRGRWPLQTCRPENGFEITDLCDLEPSALEAGRELAAIPPSHCYSDYSEALEDAEADCVIICTPTVYHVPMAKEALKRACRFWWKRAWLPIGRLPVRRSHSHAKWTAFFASPRIIVTRRWNVPFTESCMRWTIPPM